VNRAAAEPPYADPALAAALAESLAGCGFTGPEVVARLGAVDEVLVAEGTATAHERRLGHDPVDELVRLLVLQRPLDDAALDGAALHARRAVDLLVVAGVAYRAGTRVEARCSLVPHGRHWIASDLRGGVLTADHVPGVQGASITLADLTVRPRVDAALDVGTGCGIQALIAADHARRVIATDVNPRALRFAAFNAALAGVAERIELRQGSWFDPVGDEEFDLVVANPPFVISPERSYTFRDTALAPGEPSRLAVQGAVRHLRPGGHACVLVSWAEPHPAYAGPHQWVDELAAEGFDADLLLVESPREEVTVTAARWTGAERHDAHDATEALDRWLAYYREHGITAVRFAAAILRRTPSGRRPWRRRLPLPAERRGPAASALARVIAAADRVGDRPADTRQTIAVPPDVRLTTARTGVGGGWSPERGELRLPEGLGVAVDLTSDSLRAVQEVRGDTVGNVVARVSAALPADTDVDVPVRALLSRLAGLGLLEITGPKVV
jgi:methylase of polypeptide subunit release factors